MTDDGYKPPKPEETPVPGANEAVEATQGVSSEPDIPAGAPSEGVSDAQKTIDEILAELARIEVARQLGFDVKPTKAMLMDYLEAADQLWEEMEQQRPQWDYEGGFPMLGAIDIRQEEVYQAKKGQFQERVGGVLEYFQGAFGAGAGRQAEVPGDPLEQYFAAWERLGAEALGPSPEARFMNIPWVKAAIEAVTPTDFQQYMETQGPALQARYLAQMFEQFGPQLKKYGAELATLPEYSEETDTYPRFERFLGMREEFGLDFVQPYEEFVGEEIPELQQRYKFLKPMSDEEAEGAFRNVFGTSMGEGGGQITPFGTFVSQQRRSLESEFGDLVREQLRAGTEMGALPSYEEFLTGQAGELERTFQMTSPYVTGRRTPGRLARPTRKL